DFSPAPNNIARPAAAAAGKPLSWVKGAFILPPGLTNLSQPGRLLIYSVPSGGNAVASMSSMTKVALSEGWTIFAAEGPKVDVNTDTVQWGWGVLSSALDQF